MTISHLLVPNRCAAFWDAKSTFRNSLALTLSWRCFVFLGSVSRHTQHIRQCWSLRWFEIPCELKITWWSHHSFSAPQDIMTICKTETYSLGILCGMMLSSWGVHFYIASRDKISGFWNTDKLLSMSFS